MGASEQIRQNRYRCVPHLARLRMLAHDTASTPAAPWVLQEATLATRAVVAEVKVGCRAALAPAADRGAAGNASLLQPRLARLQAAAEQTVAAASLGDAAALRQHVHRFESLTSAMWPVLLSTVARPRSRARARPQPRTQMARPTLRTSLPPRPVTAHPWRAGPRP